MVQRAMPQQPAIGLQEFHDFWIRFQHMLASKFLHNLSKSPAVVDRRQNLQPFSRRRLGIVLKDEDVVFHAVARCNMDTAGPLIEGDEITKQNR